MIKEVASAAIGFGIGCFCPGVTRYIKSLFVKKTQVAETAVKGAVSSAAEDVAKKV